MCKRIQCSVCSKPTYMGCGAHIENPNVLGNVRPEDRCARNHEKKQESLGSEEAKKADHQGTHNLGSQTLLDAGSRENPVPEGSPNLQGSVRLRDVREALPKKRVPD